MHGRGSSRKAGSTRRPGGVRAGVYPRKCAWAAFPEEPLRVTSTRTQDCRGNIMKWSILAAATVVLAAAVPARAQTPYRHFEQPYWDTNRSDRIVYYPLARAFSGPR